MKNHKSEEFRLGGFSIQPTLAAFVQDVINSKCWHIVWGILIILLK
jgi:hypothetical protein